MRSSSRPRRRRAPGRNVQLFAPSLLYLRRRRESLPVTLHAAGMNTDVVAAGIGGHIRADFALPSVSVAGKNPHITYRVTYPFDNVPDGWGVTVDALLTHVATDERIETPCYYHVQRGAPADYIAGRGEAFWRLNFSPLPTEDIPDPSGDWQVRIRVYSEEFPQGATSAVLATVTVPGTWAGFGGLERSPRNPFYLRQRRSDLSDAARDVHPLCIGANHAYAGDWASRPGAHALIRSWWSSGEGNKAVFGWLDQAFQPHAWRNATPLPHTEADNPLPVGWWNYQNTQGAFECLDYYSGTRNDTSKWFRFSGRVRTTDLVAAGAGDFGLVVGYRDMNGAADPASFVFPNNPGNYIRPFNGPNGFAGEGDYLNTGGAWVDFSYDFRHTTGNALAGQPHGLPLMGLVNCSAGYWYVEQLHLCEISAQGGARISGELMWMTHMGSHLYPNPGPCENVQAYLEEFWQNDQAVHINTDEYNDRLLNAYYLGDGSFGYDWENTANIPNEALHAFTTGEESQTHYLLWNKRDRMRRLYAEFGFAPCVVMEEPGNEGSSGASLWELGRKTKAWRDADFPREILGTASPVWDFNKANWMKPDGQSLDALADHKQLWDWPYHLGQFTPLDRFKVNGQPWDISGVSPLPQKSYGWDANEGAYLRIDTKQTVDDTNHNCLCLRWIPVTTATGTKIIAKLKARWHPTNGTVANAGAELACSLYAVTGFPQSDDPSVQWANAQKIVSIPGMAAADTWSSFSMDPNTAGQFLTTPAPVPATGQRQGWVMVQFRVLDLAGYVDIAWDGLYSVAGAVETRLPDPSREWGPNVPGEYEPGGAPKDLKDYGKAVYDYLRVVYGHGQTHRPHGDLLCYVSEEHPLWQNSAAAANAEYRDGARAGVVAQAMSCANVYLNYYSAEWSDAWAARWLPVMEAHKDLALAADYGHPDWEDLNLITPTGGAAGTALDKFVVFGKWNPTTQRAVLTVRHKDYTSYNIYASRVAAGTYANGDRPDPLSGDILLPVGAGTWRVDRRNTDTMALIGTSNIAAVGGVLTVSVSNLASWVTYVVNLASAPAIDPLA